jgi:hypothetical protein
MMAAHPFLRPETVAHLTECLEDLQHELRELDQRLSFLPALRSRRDKLKQLIDLLDWRSRNPSEYPQ